MPPGAVSLAGEELVERTPIVNPGERVAHGQAMDLEAESAALTSAGWPKVAWSDLGWVYHETPFGYYVELIGPQLLERQAEMFA